MKRTADVRPQGKKQPVKQEAARSKQRVIGPSSPAFLQKFQRSGRRYAADHPLPKGAPPNAFINSLWYSCYIHEGQQIQAPQYADCMKAFLKGYCLGAGMKKPDWVLMPTLKSVAAVITVRNEGATVSKVLAELSRLPLKEIIAVVNGSADNSFSEARKCPSATIVHIPEALGYDVGRSIGAKLSTADMVLFLDGDIPIQAERLISFILAVERGADVALNDVTPFIGSFAGRDSVTMLKEFLNVVQDRRDLNANSMTAVPHVLSRKAIEHIGAGNLAVPPKAQSLAIRLGLSVCAPASVDVFKANKATGFNKGAANPVSKLILGDHLEALHMLMETNGGRLRYEDDIRQRSAFAEGTT